LKKNQIRCPDKANRLFCVPNEFNHLMIKFIYVDVCTWNKSAGQTSVMTGIKKNLRFAPIPFCAPTTARRAVLYSPVSAARKGKPNTGILFTGEAIPVNEK